MSDNCIYYPLRTAAEVVFVENALADFRMMQGDASTTQRVRITKDQWKKMTLAKKLSIIESEWTIEKLQDIAPWAMGVETVLAILDRCAQAPNTWFYFKDAAKSVGLDYFQARGQLQALGKMTAGRLDGMQWPMVAEPNPPDGGGLAYMMSQTVATRWLTVRAAQKAPNPS